MGSNTTEQYRAVMDRARQLFVAKNQDYGTAWRILRISSFVDQLFIKAKRIRSIEEHQHRAVDEGVEPEFIGLINYAALALIQLKLTADKPLELPFEEVLALYDQATTEARELMEKKNHDYGEVWREMWQSSLTDMILMKLLRVRKLIEQGGNAIASEGIDGSFYDIINYSVFALIKMQENHESNYHSH